jgi:hypothetical protein
VPSLVGKFESSTVIGEEFRQRQKDVMLLTKWK